MTSEIVDADGNIVVFPPDPPPPLEECILSALSQSTPWEVYNRLIEPAQLVVLAVLTIGVVLGLIVLLRRLHPFKTPFPGLVAFIGAAGFWLCMLLIVYIIVGSAITYTSIGGDDPFWLVPSAFACLYAVLLGKGVRIPARRAVTVIRPAEPAHG